MVPCRSPNPRRDGGGDLIAEGALDDAKLVSHYVPELSDSAFGSAVRQVMDMTAALDYNENYADPSPTSGNTRPQATPPLNPIPTSAHNFYEFLQGVEQEGVHGEAFIYKSINTVGWVIARATARILRYLRRIWKPSVWTELT